MNLKVDPETALRPVDSAVQLEIAKELHLLNQILAGVYNDNHIKRELIVRAKNIDALEHIMAHMMEVLNDPDNNIGQKDDDNSDNASDDSEQS